MNEAEHTNEDIDVSLTETGPTRHDDIDDGFGPGSMRENSWSFVAEDEVQAYHIGSDCDNDSEHSAASVNDQYCHASMETDNDSMPVNVHSHMVELLPVSKRMQLDDDIANMSFIAERSRKTMPLIWERGFAGRVLNNQSTGSVWPYVAPPHCTMPFTHAPTPVQTMKHVVPRLPFAVRRLKFAQSVPDPDALRNRALVKWRIIVETDLNSSTLGKQLIELCNDLRAEDEIVQILSDVFAPKSTATLYKRSNSLFKYILWHKDTFSGGQCVLDFSESKIYQYLRHLKSNNAAPTVLESFRQSVAFAIGLIGLQGISHAELGGRIKGICHASYVNKRVLKQARPLTVEMVKSLESIIHSDIFILPDRVFAGHCMFALLSSARFSDTQYLQSLKLSTDSAGNGLVEAGTLKHKSGLSKEDKTRLLPYIALASCFSDLGWATQWMMVRDEAGLKPWHQPVMPALDINGSWLHRPLTSGEASNWLKDLLVQTGWPLEDVDGISSHSLKTTVLSWAARWGMDLAERRLLGHHMDPQYKSVVTYSRDALLKSHVKLQTMIWEINNNVFNPDASRLEVLLEARQQLEVRQNAETSMFDGAEVNASECPVQDAGEYESEANSDDIPDEELPTIDQESLDVWSVATPENRAMIRIESDMTSYQHCSSGVIHFCRDADSFLCGRILSRNYKPTVSRDVQAWPLCGQCKLSAHAFGHTIRQLL